MPNAIFDALRVHRDPDQLVRVLPRALQPVLDFDYMSLFLDREVARGATWYVPHGEDRPSLTLTPTREIPIEAVQASVGLRAPAARRDSSVGTGHAILGCETTPERTRVFSRRAPFR